MSTALRSRCPKRSIGFAALLVLASLLPQHAFAQDVARAVDIPAALSRSQPVAPGGSGVFAFSVRREAGATNRILVITRSQPQAGMLAGYSFVAQNPSQCPSPTQSDGVTYEQLTFSVGPVAYDETLTCEYTLTRAPNAIHDLAFAVCRYTDDGPFGMMICDQPFRYGSLPDLSLTAEQAAPVMPGDMHALVRVRVTNHSAFDVVARPLTTECVEFQVPAHSAFVVETGFPGSCPAIEGFPCANFLGQGYTSYGFDLGAIAAHSSNSCLIRVNLHEPATRPALEELRFVDARVELGNGAIAIDPDVGDDSTSFGVFGIGGNAIPLSPTALAMLLMALIGAGWIELRRRSRNMM